MAKKNVRSAIKTVAAETKFYYQESFEAAEEKLKQGDPSIGVWLNTWKTFMSETMANNPEISDFDTIVLHHVKYNFDRAKTFADSLGETREQQSFFITLETDFEQFLVNAKSKFSPLAHDLADNGFGEKCRLEIAKYERLLELEGKQTSTQAPRPGEREEHIGKPCLTIDQFIMLMFAIGGSRLKGLDKNKVAQGLSSLTGNSVKGFIKGFSRVLPTDNYGIKKFTNNTDAYNKDVERVCNILTEMGLTDEVNKLKENSNL